MPAPEIIHQLVANFEQNREAYRSGKYNEARLRQAFLDKFFEALGWDVYNTNGYAPENCEVVIEDSLEVEGTAKSPDYTFRMGRDRKFFVEAKKPAVDIKYDIHPAYQLRRYAWNAHMPLSILTDFEELAVYNCKPKPDPKDSAATSRELFFRYTEYIDHWDEIAAIFSRDAVWKGSFDKFASESKGKKGTTEVDDEILKDIENWRKLLALNIALRNKPLIKNEEQLNFAVQMTIDRILFLCICEDRAIEPEDQLKTLAASPAIYPRLVDLFRRADTKYNSGLFHLHTEKGETTSADAFTPALSIDDKVLKEIISDIYYPCPYIFKEIPVEILGQVYEQFLGKVIRLTPGGTAKIEEKPEVRKAGGVYYTPTYIVDYIVKNTVGELLKDKTPEQASTFKIVDPACGSGSFLLGAFKYLLNWHYQFYTTNQPEILAKRKNAPIFPVGGGWRLTTAEKKRILTNNLYGVDIDPQAVEVTKLSLLLKVLEEESGQLTLGFERVLPDLGRNIQCGNSLIGDDYFEGQLVVDEEERKRVNPFDWQRAFPQVFAQGGFDAVISNPPYIRIQALKEWAPLQVEFYKKKYKAAAKGNYDIYVVFVEKGLSLLNQEGRLGFILPHKFFNAQYGEPLRGLIANGSHLKKVIHFGDQQVFEGATTYTCLLFLEKKANSNFEFNKVDNLEKIQANEGLQIGVINSDKVSNKEWNFASGNNQELFEKLSAIPIKLGDISKIFVGLQTSADTVFIFKKFKEVNNNFLSVFSEELQEWIEIEKQILKPVVRSGSIKRYSAIPTAYILFPYFVSNQSAILITESDFASRFPLAWKYLNRNKKLLSRREKGKWSGIEWYKFGRSQNIGMWEQSKLLVPYMVTELASYFDLKDNLYFVNVTTGGFGVRVTSPDISWFYICGLLNSRLLDFFFKRITTNFNSGYFAANKQYIERLPIRMVDFLNIPEVAQHDRLVALVEHMLDLHKRKPTTPQEQERLARDIAATDRAIDALVYQLYDLTPAEIAIVEAS